MNNCSGPAIATTHSVSFFFVFQCRCCHEPFRCLLPLLSRRLQHIHRILCDDGNAAVQTLRRLQKEDRGKSRRVILHTQNQGRLHSLSSSLSPLSPSLLLHSPFMRQCGRQRRAGRRRRGRSAPPHTREELSESRKAPGQTEKMQRACNSGRATRRSPLLLSSATRRAPPQSRSAVSAAQRQCACGARFPAEGKSPALCVLMGFKRVRSLASARRFALSASAYGCAGGYCKSKRGGCVRAAAA